MQPFSFFFLLAIRWGGGGISGRVRALNLTVPLGSGRVGSDNLGYGPGSGFSFEPVQTSTWRSAEREGCFQTEAGPLDSGCRRLGVPISRRAVPPGGEGSLHSECCLLPCVGARRLSGRHLQSCGLGDNEHLSKILQSLGIASLFLCVG